MSVLLSRVGGSQGVAMDDHAPSYEAVSDLIGAIYDCVLDPSGWDATLTRMYRQLDMANCILYVTDYQYQVIRLQKVVGVEPEWAAKISDCAGDLVELRNRIPDLMSRPIDEPMTVMQLVGVDAMIANRYYQEWAKPQGLIDSMFLHLMRGPERIAEVGLGRLERLGPITDRELGLLRIIAPHLRRAVTISDLIDMKALEADALNATLDSISVAIVLVAEDGAIVHANQAAERMFANGAPIRSVNGQLAAAEKAVSKRLRRVIAEAARAEARIGGAGIGMALSAAGRPPATSHVLPLARGDIRTRLAPRAVAAVFVTAGGAPPAAALSGVAETFGLTPAEARLLSRLALGHSIDGAAEALGITRATVKTHLRRILSKTGSRRQADLIALVHNLLPPTGPVGEYIA